MKAKIRTCSECKVKKPAESVFTTPANKAYCSPECGAKLALKEYAKSSEKKAKAKRKEFKVRKDKLNDTIPKWKAKTQKEFNKWIRLSDKDLPCISCLKPASANTFLKGSGWDAGHYKSVGTSEELRFERLNCHKQCVSCNQYKSGNVVEYRINLIKRIGIEKVEWLEGPHELPHLKVNDLKLLHAKFKALNKELTNDSRN